MISHWFAFVAIQVHFCTILQTCIFCHCWKKHFHNERWLKTVCCGEKENNALSMSSKQGRKAITCSFSSCRFSETPWLTWCSKRNKLYCWLWIIFNTDSSSWRNCEGKKRSAQDFNYATWFKARAAFQTTWVCWIIELLEYTRVFASRLNAHLQTATVFRGTFAWWMCNVLQSRKIYWACRIYKSLWCKTECVSSNN